MRQRVLGSLGFIVAILAAALVLTSWAVSSPTGSGPDDDFHGPSIWCRSSQGAETCVTVRDNGDRGEVIVRLEENRPVCYAFRPEDPGECGISENVEVRASESLYPPVFYNFASRFVGDSPIASQVPVRLAVGASVLGLFALAWLVSLPWLRVPMAVSWVVGSMPLAVSLFASINPSGWTIAALAAMWGPIVTAYLSTGARRWWAVAVWLLAVFMAAGSRGDGAVYAGLISGLALVLLWRKDRWPMLVVTGAVAIVALGLFLPSGHARTAVESFTDGVAELEPAAVLWSVVTSFPTMWSGLTGAPWGTGTVWQNPLGWLDVPMPAGVWMPITLVLGGLIFAGMKYWNVRKALAVIALLVVSIAVPARALTQVGLPMGELYQPRYIVPILLVMVGLLLIRLPAPRTLTFPIGTLVIMWVMLSYAGTIALHSWIRRYITGVDPVSASLGDPVWWDLTWASPNQVWAMGSIAWVVLVAVVLSQLRPRGSTGEPRQALPASA